MYSIKNDNNNELIIKNSKFITFLYKINNINNIDELFSKIKDMYPDATHYCYGYIIDNFKKSSDDNEPSGTAGTPILQILEHNNLNYILCIVVRYFGGIKLGSNGLIRAYSKSVTNCLKKNTIVELIKGYNIDICFNYNLVNKIDYLLKNYFILNKSFNECIKYNVNVDNNILKQLNSIKNITITLNKEIYIEKNKK